MNMNKIALTLLTGILTALSLVSCTDDELIKTGNVVEGKPVTVTMQVAFTQPSDIVITRADNTLSDLSNLIIIVYDADNTTFEAMYSSNLSTQDKYRKLTFNKSETIKGGVLYSVSFEATTGNKKLIAIANTGADDQAGRIWNLANLEVNSTSFDNLKKAVIKLQDRLYTTTDNVRPIQITSSSQMLMTGWNENITFDNSGNVTSGLDNNKVAVKLNRAMARIKFNIVAKPDGAEGTFTPSSYRIYNIPVNSYLTNTEKETTSTIADEAKFIHTSSANIGAVSGGNYSFSFYMPENINEQKKVTDYQDRDKWNSSGNTTGTSPENKTWINAPQTSTFVVISGTYSGSTTDKDGQTTNYVGNVEYTVHLGDFSNTESMGNFSIERNCSYTYNMQVLGVDNIIVEAEKEGENQPGAEGEIYTNTSAYNYLLDAHYEQVYLEYNLSAIADNVKASLEDQTDPTDVGIINQAIADNLILVIQSPMMTDRRVELKPYQSAVQSQNDTQDAKTKALQNVDYKWIEFWPQEEADKIAKYPGVSSWSRADVTTLKNPNVYGEYLSGESCTEKSEKLLDVYDVIVAMGNVVKKIYNNTITENSENNDGIIVTKKGEDYVARFTAFVNEYYYYENPSTGNIIGTWSDFTNKDTRDMIIAMSTDVSPDGNSTYSKVHSYISQLSIQTFYNSSQAREFNAFGIETYNETPLVFNFKKPTTITGNLDDSDGRSNQLRLMGANATTTNNILIYDNEEKWSEYLVESINNGWTKSIPTDRTQRKLDEELYAHQAAYDACMSRNRDLNGDGKIQDNEIRWYLASLNEYIRIGIGSSAISNEAQLYMGDKAAMERSNYPNSYLQDGALYYTSSSDGKRVFWAVEKGSYGPEGRYYSGNPVPLRCVRALPAKSEAEGTDISSISGIVAVSTYEKHNATENTPIVLEFKDRLANSLYRTRIDGGSMTVHNEDSPANLFYEGIYVSKDYLPMSYRLGDIIGYEGTESNITYSGTILNPCSEYEENGITGWRVPNLVEFSALNAAGLINSNASCCTQFSNQSVRYGFAYATSTKNIYCPDKVGDINSSYRIRCVRDVSEDYTFPTN